ncbi:MAG: CDP-diacylglycerol--glycerol-3-phosphate 3-phosphatidyltransferase [Actinomycetota bacterium]|nr:CDP-diacylglycerol--glycerol-3-phosphate 3-phosphatidyltransferase [Actinomycetota bacterium]
MTASPGPDEIPTPVDLAALPPSGAPVLNVANALTVLRLLLVPVFGVLLLVGDGHVTNWRLAAALVFVVASFTDRVDGQIARRHNLITAFGTVADPIADKALMGTALVALSALGDLPWLITALVLAREVGVTALRFWVIRHGVMPASRGGKVKTLLQTVAIGLYILPLTGWPASVGAWVMAAAVILTIVTGADYVNRALRLRTTSARAVAQRERRAQQRRAQRPAGTPVDGR